MDPIIAILYSLFLTYKLSLQDMWELQISNRYKLEICILHAAHRLKLGLPTNELLNLPEKVTLFINLYGSF